MNYEPYLFDSKDPDCQSLIHLINLTLGENLIGAEIGVYRAHSFCTFLCQIPSLKKLYGVDSFQPYSDFLKVPYDNEPAYSVDVKESNYNKLITYHNIEFTGFKDKVIFLEKDSDQALLDIEDNSLDFIFIDTYMTYEQAVNDVSKWYQKVKKGGLFSGHDWNSLQIQNAVNQFRNSLSITNKMSKFDNVWAWLK